jgi:hypothetical protein
VNRRVDFPRTVHDAAHRRRLSGAERIGQRCTVCADELQRAVHDLYKRR